ncbi:hypothetical protein BVC80_1375g8 [Macleaya cordata]|uniref:Uncharacterized protein n=1 Tax=Macleaya cordata TaxID=56857 RepID=A0A200QQQ4_MACCD|nr:hypothetical protein BVC80_1375g8 [Macleaya cordata]
MPVWRRRNNNQVANYSTTSARRSSFSSSQSNYNKRPSPHHPTRSTWVWQPTVPSWEKKFCSQVGSVPWKKLLETKKVMAYYYENIVKWDDTAGEVAFNNAKARFWAEMNGLPCDDIPLPDPDMYIDEIDWNTKIDPELQSDLDKQQLPSDDENEEDNDGSGNVWFQGDALYFMNQPVVCTGWGEDEEIHGGGSKQEAENYNYYYY